MSEHLDEVKVALVETLETKIQLTFSVKIIHWIPHLSKNSKI